MKTFSGLVAAVLLCVAFAGASARAPGGSDLPGGGDSAVGSDSAVASGSAGAGATDPAATPLAVAPCAQAGAATAPAQAGAAAWPDFDWRTVPVWLRVRKSTAYTPDELKQIAGFPLVVFEKANGHRTSGDVESGTLAAGRAVKQINPRTKVIFYFNAVIRYGDYKANAEFDRHADAWALRKGGVVFTFKDRYRLFDLTRPDVRAWWIATARGMAAHDQIDGLFIDAICKTTTHGRAYSQGYRRTAADLRAGWPAGKLLLGNAVRAGEDGCNLDHLDYLDGSYVERWGVPVGGESYEDYVARGIEAMRKTVERGKLLLFSAGPDAFGPRTSTPARAAGPAGLDARAHRLPAGRFPDRGRAALVLRVDRRPGRPPGDPGEPRLPGVSQAAGPAAGPARPRRLRLHPPLRAPRRPRGHPQQDRPPPVALTPTASQAPASHIVPGGQPPGRTRAVACSQCKANRVNRRPCALT